MCSRITPRPFARCRNWSSALPVIAMLGAAVLSPVRADVSFSDVSRQVNQKVVKVYGAGGFRGVTDYCTGVLISPDGYVLTVYSPTLDSHEIRVVLYDGTRHVCEMVAAEPVLDVALIRIKDREPFRQFPLAHYDLTQKPPEVRVGDWVLAFSNLFKIAERDEPVSVQRGVIAAIAPFAGRRGVHEAPFKGTAYIVDAITNNPGSHGGIVTNRKGELIGLIGKELKNTLTDTWVNYAMPIQDLSDFALKAKRGEYKPLARVDDKRPEEKHAFHGVVLVPDVLDRTPPFIDEVLPDSPAARAGLKTDDLVVLIHAPRNDGSGEIEEKVITSCKTFKEAMGQLDPGAAIKLVVRRGTQLLSLDLTLGPPLKPQGEGEKQPQ